AVWRFGARAGRNGNATWSRRGWSPRSAGLPRPAVGLCSSLSGEGVAYRAYLCVVLVRRATGAAYQGAFVLARTGRTVVAGGGPVGLREVAQGVVGVGLAPVRRRDRGDPPETVQLVAAGATQLVHGLF